MTIQREEMSAKAITGELLNYYLQCSQKSSVIRRWAFVSTFLGLLQGQRYLERQSTE